MVGSGNRRPEQHRPSPFFDGIPELDADVSEFGAGTATESNKIHVSTTDFDVDILINNNTIQFRYKSMTMVLWILNWINIKLRL
uniref:Uncharacterized protein n=1 Tax=Flavobacterium columnare TaxID=996 RepID=A0AA94F0U9_9FLAO